MVTTLALTGCGGPVDDSAQLVLQQDALNRAGLQFYWESKLDLRPGETLTKVWLIDDAIYYLSSQQRLFCYDPVTGIRRWNFEIPDRGQLVFPPSHGQDISITPQPIGIQGLMPGTLNTVTYKPMVINTTRTIYVLDRITGEELRRISAQPSAINTGGAMDARNVFVGLLDGTYVAFDIQEGIRTNWKGTIQEGKHGFIRANPQYMDGHLFVAATNGLVHCRIVTDKGRLEWQQNVIAAVSATPLLDRRFYLVAVEDGWLHSFDPLTGRRNWNVPFTAKRPLVDSPQAGLNTIYQYARGDRFYAIDPGKGVARWDNPHAVCVLGIFQNMVYAFSTGKDLLALTEVTGEVRHEIPMLGFTLYAPNTAYPGIFVASPNGKLACIRPVSAGRITPDMIR